MAGEQTQTSKDRCVRTRHHKLSHCHAPVGVCKKDIADEIDVNADEPRRSGRATKGQHTKDKDIAEEKPTGRKGRGRSSKAASTEPEPEEDDAVIRCICGATEDDEGLMMIACENCEAWQHNLCMSVTEDEKELEAVTYYCERCKPEQHKELLAAIKKGEKPWVAKKAQREQEKKKKKGKKGKGRRPSARTSEIGTGEEASPAPSSTKAETTGKRKHAENGAHVGVGSDMMNDAFTNQNRSQEASATPTREPDGLQKRRKSSHLVADASASSADRRQSSGAGRRTSTADSPAQSVDELEGARKKVVEALTKELKKLIEDESKSGDYRIPDGHTANSLASQIALQAEHGIAASHADSKNYNDQFRTVHFNLKSNRSLLKRLLSGSLEADALGSMSSDDMASEELQREMAKLKEEVDKQAIMIQEEGPRVRKTHKGDELIETEPAPVAEDSGYSGALRRRPTEDIEMPDADTHDDDRVELPEDVGGRPPLNVQTSGSPAHPHLRKGSSANFNINQVWDSVQSPDDQSSRPLQQPPKRRSSAKHEAPPPQSAIEDTDVDRMLKDDADDLNAEPEAVDPNALWVGRIHMAGVGEMRASASWVAGGDPSKRFPWSQLLPSTIEVDGRIPVGAADKYILGMRNARSPTDVTVLYVRPTGPDTSSFATMFDYFHTRNRWGVFQTTHMAELKDMYLIPLEYGDAPFPEFLRSLQDNILPTHRESRTFLVCMVVRSKSPPSSANATPQVNDAAPSQSPALAQGQIPSYAPQGPPGPVNLDMVPPLARSILGDFINAPTVLLMLGAVPDMEETQLSNLRHILERVPSTRDDINALSQHLRETMEIGGHVGP